MLAAFVHLWVVTQIILSCTSWPDEIFISLVEIVISEVPAKLYDFVCLCVCFC